MTNEDMQPNEIRAARKGTTTIPRIRPSTRPQNTRGVFRGGSRGRGGGFSRGSWRPFSIHSPQYALDLRNASSSTVSPPAPAALLGNSERVRYDSDRPAKRRRVANNQHPSLYSAERSSHAARQPYVPSNNVDKTKLVEVLLDLPEDCRKGAARCHSNRRFWIRQQISRMRRDQNMSVINYTFLDIQVRLECIPNAEPLALGPAQSLPVESDTARTTSNAGAQPEEASGFVQSSNGTGGECVMQHIVIPRKHQTSLANTGTNPTILYRQGGRREKREDIFHLSQTSQDQHPGKVLTRQGENVPEVIDLTSDTEDVLEELLPNAGVPSEKDVAAQDGSSDQTARSSPFFPSFRSGSLVILREDGCLANIPHRREDVEAAPLFNDSLDSNSMRSSVTEMSPSLAMGASEQDESRIAHTTSHAEIRSGVPVTHGSWDISDQSCVLQGRILQMTPHLGTASVRDSSNFHMAQPEDIIRIHQDSHDKSRKLLLSAVDILTISMRGCIDRTEIEVPRKKHALMSVPEATRQLVDDACLLPGLHTDILVLGYARHTRQLTLVHAARDNAREVSSLTRPIQTGKKGGVSAVCAMTVPRTFATGGYDHAVHLWKLTEDGQGATAQSLAIRHASLVQSLLPIRDTSHKLLSAGADCSVNVWDLSSERVVNIIKTSNSIYHTHKALSPFCTLLEVAHRELQFEIRDYRLVPERPVQRFGYDAIKPHGRFMKGDVKDSFFACGDREGVVRMWDMRNTRHPLHTVPAISGRKLTQVVFGDNHLVASSEDQRLAFIPYSALHESA